MFLLRVAYVRVHFHARKYFKLCFMLLFVVLLQCAAYPSILYFKCPMLFCKCVGIQFARFRICASLFEKIFVLPLEQIY